MAMGSLELCCPEDAVKALLEYLVEPLLPEKSSIRRTITDSQLELVAKQMHAVVLLFNYYHRKQHPQLKFEGFESFRKLAVIQQPGLWAHMTITETPENSKSDSPENQLSMTEKAIMDACNIAQSLDPSKHAPNTKEWAISKVSVFLIDSKKEKCMLQLDTITKGVWSAIENEIDVDSTKTTEEKHTNKKLRLTSRLLGVNESGCEEVDFQQFAFSAVREATGIEQSDLTIIESHITYSLSKEKSATCFYIMESIEPNNDEIFSFPIKDTIESLQGPLVKKTDCGWIYSPAVEYYHLLPYAEFLSDWFSGRGAVKPCEPAVDDDKKTFSSRDEAKNPDYSEMQQEENNGSSMALDEPSNMDVDDSALDSSKRSVTSNKDADTLENIQKTMITTGLSTLNGSTDCAKNHHSQNSSTTMGASELCLTREAIQAFLEYLVEPLLPAKSSIRRTLQDSQLELVAKQMHAVVLLFNYYHRKQQPQLNFEGFESFCKLAVILQPGLLGHMKITEMRESSKSDFPENLLSMTEKAIMDACNIAQSLDPSMNAPNTKAWPISIVSVFLVDSKKEKCMLQIDTITKGVWSAIENEIDVNSKKTMEETHVNKKLRLTSRFPRVNEKGAEEVDFQQFAFSAVKEATGIEKSDLTIIESHITYSLSKEKSATCFYIMESTKPNNDGVFLSPIKDTIESLQGPLVKKSDCGWICSPAVEYYHLLPYAEFLSDWFSGKGAVIPCKPAVDVKNTFTSGDEAKNRNYSGKQKENNGSSITLDEPKNMDVDDSAIDSSEILVKSNNDAVTLENIQKTMTTTGLSSLNGSTHCAMNHRAQTFSKTMGASELCLTDEAIQVFLEYLVEPLLPAKSSIRRTFQDSQLELVAKQMHAVVLLFNYYHRKQHPQLNFEGFESFCKLAVIRQPGLLAHIKITETPERSKPDSPENQLSPTEKAIMDACEIAQSLDSSKDAPNTKEWPISKVSVFLVDSKKEKCMLQTSTITKGVWSAIEHEINVNSKKKTEEKQVNKKLRLTSRLPRVNESGAEDVNFQQLAFSAVKDETGIEKSDLIIIGNHVTYSLSKEKSATCFYIMQSTEPVNDVVCVTPIKDTIESLQGPLVKKTGCGWTNSPAVEYYHLLPYAVFLSDWFSGKISHRFDANNGCSMSLDEPKNMYGSAIDSRKISVKSNTDADTLANRLKIMTTPRLSPLNGSTDRAKVDLKKAGNMLPSQGRKGKADHAFVPCAASLRDIEKLQSAIASKGTVLSETALKVLLNKKDKLIVQLRNIEDEVAQCDKKIETIVNGGEDGLSLIIDSLIEGCNEVSLGNTREPKASQNLEYQCPNGKTLSDGLFNMKSRLQELDGLCEKNKWMSVHTASHSDGGFEANVKIKGDDFEFSSGNKPGPSHQEARESAASEMLLKLRKLAC